MSNTQNKHIRAREIAPGNIAEQRTVNLSTRPVRLAFIINENISKEDLLKIVEFNSIIWGGYYNLLIPSDGKSLREEWWHLLFTDSPDKVVICGEISNDLVHKISERLEPYCFWLWSNDLLEKQVVEGDAFGSMPLAYPLLHHQETNPSLSSGFEVPVIPGQSPYQECVAAHIGTLSPFYVDFYVKTLNGTLSQCEAHNLNEYLEQLTRLEKKWTPIEFTKLNLSPVTQMGGAGFTIVLAGEEVTRDICLFWNLRMRPSLGRVTTILIPYASLKTKDDLAALAKWCDETVVGTNYVVLASASVSKPLMMKVRNRLVPHLKSTIEHVDVWFENFRMNSVRAFEQRNQEEQLVEGGSFRLKSPKPAFFERARFGEWLADVEFKRDREDSRNAFLPPLFSGLSPLLSGNPPAWLVERSGLPARLTKDRISYRVSHNQKFLQGTLPSNETLFSSLLNSKGYYSATTDKCRYTRGLIGLMGGLHELKLWRTIGVRDLFYRMGSNQNTYTPREMMAWLRPDRNRTTDAFEMIGDLAYKKAFLRGYKIQCPACDLTRWYGVAESPKP